MKAIIWDLDGTLIDSYDVISRSIQDALAEENIFIKQELIKEHVQTKSVTSFLDKIKEEYHYESTDILFQKYFKYNDSRNFEIKAIEHAKETLHKLTDMGIIHLMYTHKSNITFEILENLDMLKYFSKILTIDDGFKRKPDPTAINYLIDMYKLDKNEVYYVGDRELDIDSAINAGIHSILFIPTGSPGKETGKEDYVIHDLLEVINI